MTPKLLKVSDVADFLGFSAQGIYALVWKNQIPVVRISRRAIRFDPAAIAAWLREKSYSPVTGEALLQAAQKNKKGKSRAAANISSDRINDIVARAKKEVSK